MHKKLCLSVGAAVLASSALTPAAHPSSYAGVRDEAVAVGPAYKPCVNWFASRSPKDEPSFRAFSNGIACYDGRIDGRPTGEIIRWLSSARVSPLLVMRSPGGPVDNALPIGNMILTKRAKVVVSGLCASSCANYIFGIARERLLLPNSIVLFHGGVSPAAIEEAATQMREQLRAFGPASEKVEANVNRVKLKLDGQLAEQRQLMKQAGVDPQFLERFDKIDASAIDPSKCTPGTDRVAFFLSKQQLSQIGIQVSGPIPTSAAEAARILGIVGRTDRSVCLAPEELLKGS